MDFPKPNNMNIVRVIDGEGSTWKSKAGKIGKLRTYYHSAHIDDHIKVQNEHEAKNGTS
ncbi:MAG: hypothetical protein L6R36_007861 [Xanthoria steineri]|nr:MAG: hypothetical protein L6R36_007861 [Xanthoria steineri]